MDDMFKRIHDELTEGFILREYADKVGLLDVEFKAQAIEKYRNDPVFHARVRSAVEGVMQIITKHLKG